MQAYQQLVAAELRLAESIGLPDDQLRLVLCCLLQIPLCLPLARLPPRLKLAYSGFISLVLLAHIFGAHLLYALLFAVTVYATILARGRRCGALVMLGSMAVLSFAHIYRMVTDYGGWRIDFTTILMIYVGKFSYLAFSFQDGAADESLLTDDQRRNRLVELPSLLMYLSYILFLPSNVLGPIVQYRQFQDYIFGRGNYEKVPWLPCLRESLRKTGLFAVYIVVYLFVHCRFFPLDEVVNNTAGFSSVFSLIAYSYLSVDSLKFRYYSIWTLSEATLAAAGFSYDSEGLEFSLVQHFKFKEAHLELSVKTNIDNWNMSVQRWLKHCVYDRLYTQAQLRESKSRQDRATFIVLMVSAFWHGFYPGYFISFPLWSVQLATAKFLFKANTLFPKLYQFYERSGLFGYAILYVLSRFYFTFIGVYFVTLSLEITIAIMGRTYFVPELLLVSAYLLLWRLSRTKPKLPAKLQ